MSRIRDYSANQLDRVYENYIFQRQRLRKFSAQNYLRVQVGVLFKFGPIAHPFRSILGLFLPVSIYLKLLQASLILLWPLFVSFGP